MPVSRRRRRIRRPILMSASPADRGLSLVELDLGLDFLRMGRSFCNPKATARAASGIFILFMGWDYRSGTRPSPVRGRSLAVDHLAVLRDRHVNGGAALSIG